MRPRIVLAIAAREAWERRVFVAAGAAGGVVAPLVAWFMHLDGEARTILALTLTWVVGGVVAAGVGIQTLGGEIAARRIGFLFVRPVTAVEIVLGKMVGALALVALCQGLTLLPWAVIERGVWDALLGAKVRGPQLLETALPAGLGLGLVLGIALQVRSAWLLLDVIGAAVTAALIVIATGPFDALVLSRKDLAPLVLHGFLAALFAISLAAAALALVRGRTLPSRVHGWLTAALWPLIWCLAGMLVPVATWIDDASLDDLACVGDAVVPPGGRTAFVRACSWRAGRHDLEFLIDLERGTGRRFRSPSAWWRAEEPVFSDDGALAVWAASRLDRPGWTRLEGLVFGHDEPEVLLDAWPLGQAFVAPDGPWAGLANAAAVTVVPLPGGRRRGEERTIDLPMSGAHLELITTRFRDRAVAADTLRLWRRVSNQEGQPGGVVEAFDIDLHAGTATRVGRVEIAPGQTLAFSRHGDRLAAYGPRGADVSLRDGGTLQVIDGDSVPGPVWGVGFLPDGRAAVIAGEPVRRLVLVAPDGRARVVTELPGRTAVMTSSPAENVLLLAVARYGTAESALVDLATGGVRFVPAVTWPGVASIVRAHGLIPHGEAGRVLVGVDGDLVKVDPATGERRVLHGR